MFDISKKMIFQKVSVNLIYCFQYCTPIYYYMYRICLTVGDVIDQVEAEFHQKTLELEYTAEYDTLTVFNSLKIS